MKRPRIKKIKVCSCKGMSLIKYSCILCALLLTACAAVPPDKVTDDTVATSWSIYCEKYGVDCVNPTTEQENFYLDCYAGSVEEEEDLQNL